MFLLFIASVPSLAGFSKIRTIMGTVGDFNERTVEIKDLQGQNWVVDRETFRKDFDIRPGVIITVRVTENHASLRNRRLH
jgi:hypothetical protein